MGGGATGCQWHGRRNASVRGSPRDLSVRNLESSGELVVVWLELRPEVRKAEKNFRARWWAGLLPGALSLLRGSSRLLPLTSVINSVKSRCRTGFHELI